MVRDTQIWAVWMNLVVIGWFGHPLHLVSYFIRTQSLTPFWAGGDSYDTDLRPFWPRIQNSPAQVPFPGMAYWVCWRAVSLNSDGLAVSACLCSARLKLMHRTFMQYTMRLLFTVAADVWSVRTYMYTWLNLFLCLLSSSCFFYLFNQFSGD